MNPASPRVSIIVPSYNHARYLAQRFDSIDAQTFRDFELIVLDDASSDGSVEILKDRAQRMPMQLVLNETNSGSPFIQWRKGAERAKGQYLWIAESDDYAEPNFLASLVEKLEQHPSVGLAYCQSTVVDDAGNERGTWRSYTDWIDRDHWREDYVESGREECARYLLFANTIPNASAVVMRRSVFLEHTRPSANMKLCGDWLTWVQMLMVSDIAFVARPLNYHRSHDGTVRSTVRYGLHFREYTFAWRTLARFLRSDATARARLRHALAVGWMNQRINLRREDDWRWFISLVPAILVISRRSLPAMFLSYCKDRLRGVLPPAVYNVSRSMFQMR